MATFRTFGKRVRPRPAGGGGSRALLGSSDFTYLGYYNVGQLGSNSLIGGLAFTGRRVSGSVRFLILALQNPGTPERRVWEVSKPGSYGSTISTSLRSWGDIWGDGDLGGATNFGISCPDISTPDRLFATRGYDYPDDSTVGDRQRGISIRTLNDNGTVSNIQGYYGLEGVAERKIHGRVVKIPDWFQTTYSVPNYLVQGGGYLSRATSFPVSLGLVAYAFPDPTTTTLVNDPGQQRHNTVPSASRYCLSDHDGSFGPPDWYTSPGTPTSKDRGTRNNDFDNRPASQPSSAWYDSGDWHGLAPDGLARWTWGDQSWGTGDWIDNDAGTRTKHGYVITPTLGSGDVYYNTSHLENIRRSAEIQVFDPVHFAECKAGTRNPWNVQPTNRWEITSDLTPSGLYGQTESTVNGGVAGAWFDATDNIYYLFVSDTTGISGVGARIYAYSVAGS